MHQLNFIYLTLNLTRARKSTQFVRLGKTNFIKCFFYDILNRNPSIEGWIVKLNKRRSKWTKNSSNRFQSMVPPFFQTYHNSAHFFNRNNPLQVQQVFILNQWTSFACFVLYILNI